MRDSKLISQNEAQILRELARMVSELAARPVEEEKKNLWLNHNALQPGRPLIYCSPENSWHEILPGEDLKCSSPLARHWEFVLSMEIVWGNEIRDDKVIEAVFDVPHVYVETGWGLEETRHIPDMKNGAISWEAPLSNLDDLSQLRFPEIRIDHQATQERLDLAHELFDGLLQVRQRTSWWWSLGMTHTLARIRGLEQMMWDMIDNPEGLHRLMAFLRDGHLHKLRFLESNGLLALNNRGDYVGSGGFGWTNELPVGDWREDCVRLSGMWGFAESQETGTISPTMFEEFVFQYQLPILDLFGLNCYGCCEALHQRWHVVRKTPRLRRVSVSPWADLEKMAGNLTDHCIFSLKPNPADLAAPSFDEEHIRQSLRKAFEISRGCVVEAIMKDNHTVCGQPQRLYRWVDIAREESERIQN